MAGAVDLHTHAMPKPVLDWLAVRGLADLTALDQGVVRVDPVVSGVPALAPLPCLPAQYDVPARLEGMAAAGVSFHAVSLPPFLSAALARDWLLVSEAVRVGNDALASYVADAPGQLLALGTVPAGWPIAVDEARRCLDELGMAGLAVGSQGGGHDLDHPVNDDLWAFAAERETLVFIHPSASPAADRTRDHWLSQLVGYPLETALAASRLLFGGVLARYRLRICLAHGGGCLPGLRGRLDLGWRRKPAARTTPEPPAAYLDRFYYDTAVHSLPHLRRLIDDVGVAQVVLGSDFPFALSDSQPVATVRALGLPAADTDQVLARTAAGLLGLEPTEEIPDRGGAQPRGLASQARA